ncbi:uncharacterized protein RSE6_06648 [Rhynchosporium secalis]|uniref:Secreted protein n=1 Tax=Rhynchosporium secalis TaxID=38038 RepID=A0A1E1MBW6_RHYSE|nr:uncharacterized protein RSE6_06648 [Rhynchosporium secalis]
MVRSLLLLLLLERRILLACILADEAEWELHDRFDSLAAQLAARSLQIAVYNVGVGVGVGLLKRVQDAESHSKYDIILTRLVEWLATYIYASVRTLVPDAQISG